MLNNKKTIILAAISSLLIASCANSPVRNPFESRPEPKLSDVPAAKIASAPFTVNWTNKSLAKNTKAEKLLPVTHKNIVYAADSKGKLTAINTKGQELWAQKTNLKFLAGPSIVDNKLILTSRDGKVHAFNLQGEKVWAKDVTSEIVSKAIGAQNVVVLHAFDGTIYALSSDTGEKLWSVEQATPALLLRAASSPVIYEDYVLVGLASGKLIALNLQSGMIEWEKTIASANGRSEIDKMVDIAADPLVIGNTVYVISFQGKLAAIDIISGSEIWSKDIASYKNITHKGDNLVITSQDNILWNIDKNTGQTIWKQAALAKRYITAPIIQNNKVIIGDRGGVVHVIDLENGQIIANQKYAKKIINPLVKTNNGLIISTNDGSLINLRA